MPSTPPSFVKPATRPASSSRGSVSSTPTSDHVPLETYANDEVSAGTATTADAVSCEPTSVTGVWAGRPVAAATSGRSVPRVVPGSAIGARIDGSMPTSAASPASQRPVRGSSSPVVDALVRSATATPVSQYPIRSGMRRTVRTAANVGSARAASSW